MDVTDWIAHLDDAGRRLADAASAAELDAGLGAPVPTCPDWRVRDLLLHVGGVHRWASRVLCDGATGFGYAGERHGDAGLIDWFREGHAALVHALRDAPADLDCWTFFSAPSSLAFWARRQAHETTVHRVDAESAAGERFPISAELAADGVDELLTGFVAGRARKLRSDPPRVLEVSTVDTNDRWQLAVSTTEPVVVQGKLPDTVITGPASNVYLALWNRASLDTLKITGDRWLIDNWPRLVRVG